MTTNKRRVDRLEATQCARRIAFSTFAERWPGEDTTPAVAEARAAHGLGAKDVHFVTIYEARPGAAR